MLWPLVRTLLTGSPLTLILVLQGKYRKKSCVIDGEYEIRNVTILSKVLCLGKGQPGVEPRFLQIDFLKINPFTGPSFR